MTVLADPRTSLGKNAIAASKKRLRAMLPQAVLNWREARFYGRYGEVELHLLDLLCRRDADAIDVGANDGSYVHFLLHRCRRVHAFEPMPQLAATLRRKFGRQIDLHDVALSNASGTAELRMPVVDGVVVTGCSTVSDFASATYPGHRAVSVKMRRLDDIYDGNVGFIKIDVEGHEQAVLDGAARTIARCRPRMLVEIDQRLAPGGLATATQFFQRLGYSGHFIWQRRLEPVTRFRAAEMQDPANLPDLTAPLSVRERFGRYIYNFIFLSTEESPGIVARLRERIRRL